jgi:prepilin-type N-terminal cleavage/methylation domain-containing protein
VNIQKQKKQKRRDIEAGLRYSTRSSHYLLPTTYSLQPTAYNLQPKQGFTLVELLIVIAISLIVLAAAVPIYGNLQGTAQLNDVTSGIIQATRTARERSMNRLDNSSHGVYIDIATGDDSYVLYQGDSYATRDSSYDRSTTLDTAIVLSTTISGADINFSKGLGIPNNTGTITVTHDVNGAETITINALGSVDLN